MRNTYELQLRAMCPIHKELTDVYSVVIRSDATVKVETILDFVKKYESAQILQEDLTQEISVGLGVHVETVGFHSGVKVTCVAPNA